MTKDIDSLMLTGDFNLAENLITKALTEDPDNLSLRYRIASIFLRQGKMEEAVANLSFVYSRDPENIANISTYTTVLARLGQFELALTILKQFEDKFGENSRLLYTKADIFVRLLNWPLAKKYMELYRGKYQDNLAINLSYCSVLIKLQEFEKANQILEKLLTEFPNNARIETLLSEVRIENIRYINTMANINQKGNLHLVSHTDHLIDADITYEYQDKKSAFDKYSHMAEKFLDVIESKIAMIDCALAMGEFDTAKKLWAEILDAKLYHSSLLTLERAAQSYACDEDISNLLLLTQKNIQSNIPNIQDIKKIAIVGGSNSIMLKGWAHAFQASMHRVFKISVNNYGLGGISSLYGLTIIKERQLFDQYDLLIFEYTLNDIYFNSINGYSEALIKSMVNELGNAVSKTNCKLLICEFVPLSELNKKLNNESIVANIYKNIACQNQINYFSSTEFISSLNYSKASIDQLYNDEMHFTSKFSHRISNKLIEIVNTCNLSKTIIPSRIPLKKKSNFTLAGIKLVKPNQLKIIGNSTEIYRETKIIKSVFVKLDKQGALEFHLKPGQILLGVMINSSISTGYIKVYFGKQLIFVKNIFAHRPSSDTEKPRIFLRQFSQLLQANDYVKVIITPNVTNQDLENLPLDVTAYPAISLCELPLQELEISGVLIA